MTAVRLARATRDDLLRQASVLAALAAWFTYTRFFWTLRGVHATLPACPFLAVTGHPCPLCGGTRSFAYMWQGDLADAARLYPLGPLLFGGTFFGIGGLAAGLLSGRTLDWRPSPGLRRGLLALAVLVLAVSWALKLTVLPN